MAHFVRFMFGMKDDCYALIGIVLLGSPFQERGNILWHASFFTSLWGFGLREPIRF